MCLELQNNISFYAYIQIYMPKEIKVITIQQNQILEIPNDNIDIEPQEIQETTVDTIEHKELHQDIVETVEPQDVKPDLVESVIKVKKQE